MATLLPMDDRLSKLMTKLEETDAKVAEIQRKIGANGAGLQTTSTVAEAPLFSEFTSRGVLSALKDIEIKVNKMAADKTAGAAGSALTGNREIQQKTLDVVNDVAGKVDFILDKMVVKRQQNGGKTADEASEDVYDDGDSDYPSGPGGEGGGSGMNQAERSFVKLWRRMLQPVRRANRRFETLDKVLTQLDKVANASSVARRDDRQLRDDVAALLECCRGNDAGVRGLARSVEALGETVRAGQTDENRCAAESDLQARLQHTKGELVRQLGDLFKEQMSAGVERIRQTCIGQRKKSHHPVQGGPNGTSVRYNNSNSFSFFFVLFVIINHILRNDDNIRCISEDESTTESSIPSQGQPTPVGPDMAGKRDAEESVESATAPTDVATTPGGNGKIGLRGCHDLRLAGESESRIYSLASGKELNEGGRDYNTRYCDMTTDGGGWTVYTLSLFLSLIAHKKKMSKVILFFWGGGGCHYYSGCRILPSTRY